MSSNEGHAVARKTEPAGARTRWNLLGATCRAREPWNRAFLLCSQQVGSVVPTVVWSPWETGGWRVDVAFPKRYEKTREAGWVRLSAVRQGPGLSSTLPEFPSSSTRFPDAFSFVGMAYWPRCAQCGEWLDILTNRQFRRPSCHAPSWQQVNLWFLCFSIAVACVGCRLNSAILFGVWVHAGELGALRRRESCRDQRVTALGIGSLLPVLRQLLASYWVVLAMKRRRR